MTIYECLGIEDVLINETIPISLIIENIDNLKLRRKANIYFDSVENVSLRASISNRSNDYIQVVEVDLRNADYINDISTMIQKAIRYQVLFVFNYGGKYLILRRSFKINKKTDCVSTNTVSFCTDWIYKEHLVDELLEFLYFDQKSEWDCEDFDDEFYYDDAYDDDFYDEEKHNDNRGTLSFDEVIERAELIKSSIAEGEVVCLRFLVDWLDLHAIGREVNIYDVLDWVGELEAYRMIGDYLFVEKNAVISAIVELKNTPYEVSLDHTGKSPVSCFAKVVEPATFDFSENLTRYILRRDSISTDDDYNKDDDASPYREVKCGSVGPIGSHMMLFPNQGTPTTKFIDDIIIKHQSK